MKKSKIQHFLIVFLFVFASCNMFHPIDIIDKGKQIIEANRSAFDSLVALSYQIAPDSCSMYGILTSSRTDYFDPNIFYYDKADKNIKEGETFDISSKEEDLINHLLPKEDCSDFMFVKGLYVAFSHDHYRDYDYRYAEIIYCSDKNKFKKLFPDYRFYEKGQEKEIPEKSKWVYFYDNNWAITTRSIYFHKTQQECLELIK